MDDFLRRLKPVSLSDLAEDDLECSVCYQPFEEMDDNPGDELVRAVEGRERHWPVKS